MTTWITVCDTCRVDANADPGDGVRDGARLAEMVEAEVRPGVKTRRTACLMGCAHGCNVAIQGAGKIAYTLGRFAPEAAAAAAIADYAALHAASPNGQVPFRTWPLGVKGHFVTRHPPLPDTE